MATAVPTVTTRRLIAGLAASGALLAGLLIPLAPAHAHAAAPHRNGVQDDYSSDFYYDPGSPCDASICDSTAYSPNTDYYYDPGSSCDASICDAGLYNPTGDFYYDPGSSTDSNLIDTSSIDTSGGDTGGSGGAVVVLTRNHNREYLISGIVDDLSSNTARDDALQVSAVVSSLDVLHTIIAAPKHMVGFKDATHTYALAYPRGWTRLKTTSGLNLALRSPDAGAVVGGVSVPAPASLRQLTPDALRQVLGGIGQSLGTIQGPPVFHNVSYRGVVGHATVFSFRRGNGSTGRAILVVALHKAHLCAVTGIVADGHAANATHDAAQLSWVVSSLRFR